MRNLILGAVTLALTSLASPLVNPASAVERAYCAIGTTACAESCDYASLEQCRAAISGGSGYCASNPRFTSAANAIASTPRPRR